MGRMNEKSSCPVLRGRDGGNIILLLDHPAAVSTNTDKAMIVTGRGIRSLKRQSRCTKYSRRWKKLQRAKNKQCRRIERRVRDMLHKATRQVIDFCIENEVGSLFVGNPHGVRNQDNGSRHNQRMSLILKCRFLVPSRIYALARPGVVGGQTRPNVV